MYFYAQPLESHLGCRLQGCRVRHALHITMSRLIGGRARYCKFGVLHLLKAGESMWMGTPAANMSLASISWYKVSKKACLNKSLQKPSSRKQQLPDCISTESSSAEARLKAIQLANLNLHHHHHHHHHHHLLSTSKYILPAHRCWGLHPRIHGVGIGKLPNVIPLPSPS